jgi:RecB family exonuclease
MNTLSRCEMQYFFRRVELRILPPAVAMVVGTATHKSVEANMQSKLKDGKLLEVAAIKEIAAVTLNQRWEAEGILLTDEEWAAGEKMVRGEAVDKAVNLSVCHHKVLAPTIRPTAVERKWVIELEGYPMDLGGQIDLQEKDCIRDTKTSAKSITQDVADKSDQLTMYALAGKVNDGAIPGSLALDNLVALKRGAKANTLWTKRDEQDVQIFLRRIERAIEVIQTGKFMPCSSDSWCCNPKWCGYFSICPFSKKPVSVPVNADDKKVLDRIAGG